MPGAEFAELPVDSIRPNPKQPRTVFDEDQLAELVHSIREIGVLQPVVVRRIAEAELAEADGKQFELIMGERRWRATREAGLAVIPAIIKDTHDDDLLRDALLENLHRSQLNPLEEAAAYQQLLDDFGCSHEELAARIGRSRPQISNTLRLLKLPPLVQRRLAAGVLSAGHARALLGLSDGAAMERMAQRIVAEGLSVRTVEELVSLGDDDTPGASPAAPERAAGTHSSTTSRRTSPTTSRLGSTSPWANARARSPSSSPPSRTSGASWASWASRGSTDPPRRLRGHRHRGHRGHRRDSRPSCLRVTPSMRWRAVSERAFAGRPVEASSPQGRFADEAKRSGR